MPLPDGSPTRGERNRNPGNIMYNAHIPYRGMIGPEDHVPPVFAKFDTAENGIRAIGVCLLAYYKHHGLNTIKGIICRWSATDQAEYVKNVTCLFFNLDPKTTPDSVIEQYANEPLILNSFTTLRTLTDGIIRQENGGDSAYDLPVVTAGINHAIAGYLA